MSNFVTALGRQILRRPGQEAVPGEGGIRLGQRERLLAGPADPLLRLAVVRGAAKPWRMPVPAPPSGILDLAGVMEVQSSDGLRSTIQANDTYAIPPGQSLPRQAPPSRSGPPTRRLRPRDPPMTAPFPPLMSPLSEICSLSLLSRVSRAASRTSSRFCFLASLSSFSASRAILFLGELRDQQCDCLLILRHLRVNSFCYSG